MSREIILGEQNLALAEGLVTCIKNEDEEGASRYLEQLTQKRESQLLQEVGKLTRELHTALNGFNLDAQLSELAEHDFSDARERLRYVISLTDQAANTTLNAVEDMLPRCDQLNGRISEIQARWARFLKRDMKAEEFRAFSRQLESCLKEWEQDVRGFKNSLNEILMAQDFQDLTGQILHRVIELVENVEANLVGLIKVAGKRTGKGIDTGKRERASIEASGPKVPGVDEWNSVAGQDEVDELLSSLGF